jgi:very-short-patch-repair endonuclease
MKTEEILGLWSVTEKGKCVPLSYDQLSREINRNVPDVVAHKLINQLEVDDYIETTSRGERILTQKGLKERIPLKKVIKPDSTPNDEATWLKFRRLCNYYKDCVHQSEKSQEYLFLNNLNNKFLLPSLPIGWLPEPNNKPFKIGTSNPQQVALNRIKGRTDEDEDVYIGYPLNSFVGVRGETIFSPIFLIPVDFDIIDIKLTPRHDEIGINQSWLEFAVKKIEQKEFIEAICSCEGDTKGLIDMRLAIQYISNKFKIVLNPDYLDYDLSPNVKGIINSAALFIGDGLKYSKTLKKELLYISKQSARVLDQTALAYVFRNPPLPNKYEGNNDIPFDFIACNSEQHKALFEALNQPASKVTGPPGTGKSQVAVNLIANLVYRDKSVLFTSKNHKAIHSIYDKSEAASPSLPLIQFCSKPDDSSGSVWYSQDIEGLIGTCVSVRDKLSMDKKYSIERVSDAEQDWRDYMADIISHEALREKMAEINAALEYIKESLPIQENEINHKFANQLNILVSKLDICEGRSSIWKRILRFILGTKSSISAETQLRSLLPNLSAEARSSKALHERVDRLCGRIINYLQLLEEKGKIRSQSDNNPYAPILERLTKIHSSIHKNLQDAFILKRANSVCSINPEVKKNLMNAASLLRRKNLPFLQRVIDIGTLNEAQDAFVQFAKFFPAWASTLLSLTKASPCVAGLFDRVIIDEASQCEIPPMIPALFRSKGVTLIGDPKQFPPVITMRENLHAHIRYVKNKLTDKDDESFDYINHSAYDLLIVPPVLLREHFRCNEDVADYFNDAYYEGKLKFRTNIEALKFPKNMGFKRGLEWREISTCLEDEMKEVETLLEGLVNNGYDGTIGIITPFRDVANKLATRLNRFTGRLEKFDINNDVNTANGFQGGERDLIIFVLAMTDELSEGQDWYALDEKNKYIYNVAASRARACLIIVGNRQRALNSSSGVLRKLAQPLRPAKKLFQSPWEKKLYDELVKVGLQPKPQYALAGRYLDLAFDEKKLDIEVDGQAYHLNKFGERKQDDVYRDLTITSCGWRVMRFWVNELQEDMDGCIAKIRDVLK